MKTRILLSIAFIASILVAGCGSSGSSATKATTPTITWATPSPINFGTALSTAQLDATASVPGSFAYSPAVGKVLTGGSQTLSVVFTPNDTVTYTTATASVTLVVNPPATKIATTITWPTPYPITYGTALSTYQLDALASVPGTFTYSPALNAVPKAGNVTLSLSFTPTDSVDYASATDSVQLTVNPATPSIAWATAETITTGQSLSSVLVAGTVPPGTFTYVITSPAANAGPAAPSAVLPTGVYGITTTFVPTDAVDYTQAVAMNVLTVAPASGDAVVDFGSGSASQIIRGFGGSEAWSGPMPAAQINALYGTASNQIGLDIMRLRIAPTTWDSSTQTADTTQWTGELTNGAAVQALGGIVFATPWTAPATMKTNNSIHEGSLSTTSYGDFANYLQAYINYAATQNVNLYAISVQNEPDWNPCVVNGVDGGPNGSGCYESELWTGAQMDTWVANNSQGLTTKLMMPESYYFANTMSDPALNDTNAVGNISIVGGHLYGSRPYYYTLAKSLNKDVWVTEHTISLAGGSTATTQSITDAINMAEELHNSMAVAQYNAYVYWWMVDSAQGTTSGTYTGLIDPSGNMTYFGAAMAQFARFVRPGYYRYNATTIPANGVYVSAYAGNGHQVIVAINSNAVSQSVPFMVLNQTVTSFTPYQTSSSGNVVAQSAVPVTSNSFTYTLPPQSITTFVQ